MSTHDGPIPANEQQASERRLKRWRAEYQLLSQMDERIVNLMRELEIEIVTEEQRLGILAISPNHRESEADLAPPE